MSPLKHLFRIVGCYVLTAVVFAIPAVIVWAWGDEFAADSIGRKLQATWLPLAFSAAALGVALVGFVQTVPLLAFWGRPKDLLDKLKGDLHSPKLWKQRRVLQALACHYEHPFGRVVCWPLSLQTRIQIRNMILLYKEWLQVSKQFAQDQALLPYIVRKMQSPAKIALWRKLRGLRLWGIRPPSPEWKLPPVPADRLVAEFRGRIEEALRRTADILNHTPLKRFSAAESRVRDVLGELFWDTLESAVRLAIDADAAAREKRVRPADRLGVTVEAALDRANDAVKDAILDVGLEDDEPPPDPERQPLPPVDPIRLAAALREPIEGTLAAVTARVNAASDLESVASSEEEIHDLFDALAGHALELAAGMRVDAAAARLPWPAAKGEWAKRLRRMTVLESVQEPTAEGRGSPGP